MYTVLVDSVENYNLNIHINQYINLQNIHIHMDYSFYLTNLQDTLLIPLRYPQGSFGREPMIFSKWE